MKKLALTIICALATAGAAFAQGYVSWSTPAGSITAQTNSTVYSPLFGGGSTGGGAIGVTANGASSGLHYMYELLYQAQSGYQVLATDTHVWDGTWFDTGLAATNSFTASRLAPAGMSGDQQMLYPSATGWAAGTTNSIVLVGWSTTLGTSWLQVSNECVLAYANPNKFFTVAGDPQNSILCFFGISTFGYVNPNVKSPGASVFGAVNGNGMPIISLLTPLYEVPIPEPATFALVGLGGLSLLLFRRRK